MLGELMAEPCSKIQLLNNVGRSCDVSSLEPNRQFETNHAAYCITPLKGPIIHAASYVLTSILTHHRNCILLLYCLQPRGAGYA